MTMNYRDAGVDIALGNRAVELMKGAVGRTYTPHVLAGVGAFGGLFSARAFADLSDPVLVASTDGVGTKTKVAVQAGRFGGLGADIVHHCTNDLLVQGARPLFFLDYIAMGQLVPERVAEVVTGAAQACQKLGVALLGGETAEMPGVYLEGELDLVGTLIGVVDRANIVDGSTLEAGDVLIGLPSSGLHTNGFSLARRVLEGLDMNVARADLNGQSLFDALLEPHREYLGAYQALQDAGLEVRGMAHITGGGLVENLPRVFPAGLGARIERSSWPVPTLFQLIVQRSGIDAREAHTALNMGIGFVFMLPTSQLERAMRTLEGAGETPYPLGTVQAGEGVVLE